MFGKNTKLPKCLPTKSKCYTFSNVVLLELYCFVDILLINILNIILWCTF